MDTTTATSDGVFAPPPVNAAATAPAVSVQDSVSVGTNAADQQTITSRRQRFNTAGVVAAFAGAAILILGLVALARGEFDRTFTTPVFEVAGFDHTQVLTMIEIVFGGLLLVAGMTNSLSGMRILGAAGIIGAFVALIEPNVLGGKLEVEGGYATMILLLGAATLIAAAALPTIERQSRRVSTHHQADKSQNEQVS